MGIVTDPIRLLNPFEKSNGDNTYNNKCKLIFLQYSIHQYNIRKKSDVCAKFFEYCRLVRWFKTLISTLYNFCRSKFRSDFGYLKYPSDIVCRMSDGFGDGK